MEKYKLGIYDVTIAAQYLESFQDFQNLEMATKKAHGIMDKYHYNPIPLTKEIRPYFGHVETLHIYNKGDEEFKDEEFYKRIIHYEVSYSEWKEKEKKENEIYKNVKLTEEESKEVIEFGIFMFVKSSSFQKQLSPIEVIPSGISFNLYS